MSAMVKAHRPFCALGLFCMINYLTEKFVSVQFSDSVAQISNRIFYNQRHFWNGQETEPRKVCMPFLNAYK